ncbi:MAG TPA: hypothetical protein VFU78_03935 [Thermomicrobiales bacterium]|nr:hypothetical protein [Thermomicrobiales bacterium]
MGRARGARRRGWLLVVLVALIVLPAGMLARPARAASLAVRITASAGFGGNYRAETWLPVAVALANDGPDATGDVVAQIASRPGPAQGPYAQRVELPTHSQKALTLLVRVPAGTSSISVSFTSQQGSVAAPAVIVRELGQGQRLVGIVADDATAGNDLARAVLGAYGSGVETAVFAPDNLPASTFGLDSLAALVIGDASTGRWSAEQRAALSGWVARGGQLLVTGGANWRKIGDGLGDLAPLRPTDSRTMNNLDGLARLGGGGNGPAGQAVVSIGSAVAGATTLAEQDGVALAVSRAWGRGTVTALAFDPGASAFAAWGGAGKFWRAFGLDTAPAPALASPFENGYKTSNIMDVMRDLPSLALPPTWALGLVLLLYIVLVGPVNYLVLKRLDRRELAWATIPLLTIIFTGAVYAFGATTKGRSVVVNTVSVVRIAPEQRAAEALAFYGIFTPSRGTRSFETGQPALFTGFSPNGLGDANDLGGDARFVQGQNGGVRDASFAQWTQRTVAAQAAVDPAPLALHVELRRTSGKIVGTITNPTSEAVEGVVLVLDGAYEQVGDLAPGAVANVDWTPAKTSITSSGYYQPGLGSQLYQQSGSGYYTRSSGSLGVAGRRAAVLDALSGQVLAYGPKQQPGHVPYQPYPAPTPTPTPTPATGGASTAASNPVQVVFWRPDTPLELHLDAGQRTLTSVVIQEVVPGAP